MTAELYETQNDCADPWVAMVRQLDPGHTEFQKGPCPVLQLSPLYWSIPLLVYVLLRDGFTPFTPIVMFIVVCP